MMSIEKFLAFLIVFGLLILNTSFLYFGWEVGVAGYYTNFSGFLSEPILILFTLLLIFIFVSSSYIFSGRGIKKNSLRISLFLSLILVLSSIFNRIIELFYLKFIIWSYLNTILYLVLFFIILLISLELYKILQNMLEKNK
jgi:hypothetical protein